MAEGDSDRATYDELLRARETIADLETALKTSREIGAAIGVVMATRKLPYDEAFAVLCAASQRTNRKLRDLATDVVFTGALPAEHRYSSP